MNLIDRAVLFAVNAHAGATRKGKTRPYILHPLEVMTTVSAMTDDQEVLAAAVLHDTLEDTPATREDLEREFGSRVAALVSHESENKRPGVSPASTWLTRKQETVDRLRSASREEKTICLGDKLSNLREMGRDLSEAGSAFWDRFNQKDPAMHAWYYAEIYRILASEFGDAPPIREYKALLGQVFKIAWE